MWRRKTRNRMKPSELQQRRVGNSRSDYPPAGCGSVDKAAPLSTLLATANLWHGCHSKPGVVFARHSVVIAVHLGVRTVPQEVLGLGSRTHLAAVLPAVTRETLRGLCNRDCWCPNGLIFRLRLCRRYGDVLLVIAPPAKGKQRVNYQLLQGLTIFQYFPCLKVQDFLCSDFPPSEPELVDKAAPLLTLLAMGF